MKLVQITPGAGGMYCGNCFRDNALVAALKQLGHETLLVPLYLPMTLDEESQAPGARIFYGGVSVFLEQKIPWFRRAPAWVHRWLASPRLLKLAAGRAASTRPEQVGDLTLSMLQGEQGFQARELEQLIDFLRTSFRPDFIGLSNGMLLGLARQLKAATGARIVGTLQGEDSFLDALPDHFRVACWKTLGERAADADVLIAPSQYYAERLSARLALPAGRIRVVPNGIRMDGFEPRSYGPAAGGPLTIGFFARMCREKGLDTLVEAFRRVAKRGRVPAPLLKVGGSCGPSDLPLVEELKAKLRADGILDRVSWHPNLDRATKADFFRSLDVFSVPALYGEAFGLYLIEAMAAGVPVVQPRHAAFPEIIETTGGGVLVEPGRPEALAEGLEDLLADAPRRAALGQAGAAGARRCYSVEHMSKSLLEACGISC